MTTSRGVTLAEVIFWSMIVVALGMVFLMLGTGRRALAADGGAWFHGGSVNRSVASEGRPHGILSYLWPQREPVLTQGCGSGWDPTKRHRADATCLIIADRPLAARPAPASSTSPSGGG